MCVLVVDELQLMFGAEMKINWILYKTPRLLKEIQSSWSHLGNLQLYHCSAQESLLRLSEEEGMGQKPGACSESRLYPGCSESGRTTGAFASYSSASGMYFWDAEMAFCSRTGRHG